MSMNPPVCHQESGIQRINIEVEFLITGRPTTETIPKQKFPGNTTELLISQTTNSEKCVRFTHRMTPYHGYPDRDPIGAEIRSKEKTGKVTRAGGRGEML